MRKLNKILLSGETIYATLMLMKLTPWAVLAGVLVSFISVSPANAIPTPAPDVIPACGVEGDNSDLRGVEVCYLSASFVESDETELQMDTDFRLVFQDQDAPNPGQGFAGLVVSTEKFITESDGDNTFTFWSSPEPGDRVSYVVAYPVVDRDPDGETEGLRGTDIKNGVFAVTTASDFSYTKTIEAAGQREWVELAVEMTFVLDWLRNDCFFDFDSQDMDSNFLTPTPECEVANGTEVGGVTIISEAFVINYVSFFTPLTFAPGDLESESFVNSRTDTGYLNHSGTGLQWFNDEGAFQFQLVGPSFADGTDPNTGSLQAFLPEGYMKEIYGQDFDPANPTWQPARFDVRDDGLEVQDLSDTVQTSARNGGLLIELDSYPFSAPVFSFASAGPSAQSGVPTSVAEKRSDLPAIHLDLQVEIGEPISGASVVIGGQGLAGDSPYTLTVRSTPQTVGSGTASALGNFSTTESMPALAPGSHTLTLTATAPDGSSLSLVQSFSVGADGTVTALGTPAGSAGAVLAATGSDQLVMLWSVGLAMLMLVAGVSALAASRMRSE